ncbi:hypothetical protein TM51_08021 [Thermobifida fusca TM51]|uniref:Uncharacterized protein n=1 Tax=Thermobifida fusca TM51 TaxID=1169414 RepID=A0A9P2WQD8_THEFU|nr:MULTISPECIES: hypothetical protein [Thermobifida]EOR71417.1 hypothetical protein TM51_08021 [Thermobifida fusca TM51]MDD6792728.1 hypothetical protein [Thermobifida fusca]
MNDVSRPHPVIDPDLPEKARTQLETALHPPQDTPPAEHRRTLLPQPIADHPVATVVITLLVLLVGMRLLARVFVFVAAAVLLIGAGILLVALLAPRRDPQRAARQLRDRYRDHYVTADDLDEEAAALLARAQRAVATITSAHVVRDDILDVALNTAVLPRQLWETARALRSLTELRSRPTPSHGDDTTIAMLLDDRKRALQAIHQSVADRVAALEDYATRVSEAEQAWQRVATLRRLIAEQEELRDLLAATAADEVAVRELAELTERARAAEAHLQNAAHQAAQAALRLPGVD